MKKLLSIVAITTLFASCNSVSNYYQIYKVNPSENMVKKENLLVFEDDNCIVSYDLWENGGNIGFNIYNKSNKNLHLNLEQSFFILNNVANNYFLNRVYSNSSNSGTITQSSSSASKFITGFNNFNLLQTNNKTVSSSLGLVNSSGYSVSFNEEKIVIIPPKSSKYVMEYSINNTVYKDCDLFKYPTKKQIKTKTFSKTDSPLVFSNKIAYFMDSSEKLIVFDNSFFISEITNYAEKEAFYSKTDEYCGKKALTKSYYFNDESPDKFYVKYIKK